MSPHVTQRILACTAASALLLTGVAFALWGAAAAVGALAAGLVASANWAATLVLSKRLVAGMFTRRGFGIALMFKSASLLLLCWILVAQIGVDFHGFTLGIGSLVLGVLGGWAMTPPARAVAEEG